MNVAPPHGVLDFAGKANRSRLSRQAAAGGAIRLAPGVYAVGAMLRPAEVARHHLHEIIAHAWPRGVLCGRTAFAGGVPSGGLVFVAHPEPPRRSPLALPGVTVVPAVGPPPLPGDMAMPHGLAMSGPARRLVENVALRGRPASFRAGTAAVNDQVDDLARSGGAGRVQATLDQLDVIAGSFDPVAVTAVRARLVAVLGTTSDVSLDFTGRLAARLAGQPYDGYRIEMLEGLVELLLARAPAPVSVTPPPGRWEWLAFFEAYFSNFIEGTEFGVDEARRIVVDGIEPTSRPQDAHDVSATFRLARDAAERTRVPRNGDELVAILTNRHRILMAARPDRRPGEVKSVPNFAGGYQFVEPALVVGTLTKGFETLDCLHNPMARAVSMMALVTECHPFDDGNGRIARLAANAELSAAGEVRIVIPNVFRSDYLAALTGFSNRAGRGESLVAVLEYAQRWSAAVDWSTYERANGILQETNAYLDAGVADRSGLRLVIPR